MKFKAKLYEVNKGKNIVDFLDSPFSKIIAKPNHINRVISVVSNKLNTNKNTPLAKGMKIELRTWKKFVQGKYIKSLTYERINRFCDLSILEARNGIFFIDEIEHPYIPLNFDSKEGVRMDVGILNEGRMRNRSIEYHNKDKKVLNRIIQCSKRILSKKFNPKIGIDKRNNTSCIYFPPIFAKHYAKLGFTEKSKNQSPLRIPSYILENERYHGIWWQGNLSEEASIYPLVQEKKGVFYTFPRIQLNRVKWINLHLNNLKKENTYYCKDIPKKYLKFLRLNPIKLMLDEANILKTFDINVQPSFSKIYKSKLDQITAAYTILLYKLNDLENYLEDVGFELYRHKKQLKLLLDKRGGHSKTEIRDIIVKFYKLVPVYLRGIKRIDSNKWLIDEDKEELLGERHD